MGRVRAVCISEKKGTPKRDIGRSLLIREFGLEKDAHAGSPRQVSMLAAEEVEAFRERSKGELPPGIFGENLLVEGFDLAKCPVGTQFQIGDVLLRLTQIGKQCHSGCVIMQKTGECIMPRQGVFAEVLQGGVVTSGDRILRLPPEQREQGSPFRAVILTASDRSFRGERKDQSGPKIAELLSAAKYEIVGTELLPDDEEDLVNVMTEICDIERPDVLFTTGGTGFSPRDRMPEATRRIAERDVPGIAEGIRAYSLTITPRAMLSRAVSVIRGGTLIVNLPGSPKAVEECLTYLLPVLEHGLGILRGEADG